MIPQFKNRKVLCIGEVLWDNLSGQSRPGGALLNIATHLQNFEIPVTLVSKVGTDTKGIELLEYVRKSGLNTEAIYFDESLSTSEVKVNIDRNKNIKYKIGKDEAWDNLGINMRIVDHAGKAGTMVFGSLASRNPKTRKTIEILLGLDIVKVLDVNLRPPFVNVDSIEFLLRKADIVNLTEVELEQILKWRNKVYTNDKDKLKWLSENFDCEIVLMTKDKAGAVAYHNNVLISHPGYEVNSVDFIGTGAGFLSGFLASLIERKSIQLSLEEACGYSALISMSAGALPEYFSKGRKVIIEKLNNIKSNT